MSAGAIPVRLDVARAVRLDWLVASDGVRAHARVVTEVESWNVLVMSAAAVFHVSVSLALHAWGRWIARRLATKAWRLASWLPLTALALSIVGVCGSSVYMVRAFRGVADAPAAERSSMLAQSIAGAMTLTAATVGIAMLMYVASIVAFAVGTARAEAGHSARGSAARS